MQNGDDLDIYISVMKPLRDATYHVAFTGDAYNAIDTIRPLAEQSSFRMIEICDIDFNHLAICNINDFGSGITELGLLPEKMVVKLGGFATLYSDHPSHFGAIFVNASEDIGAHLDEIDEEFCTNYIKNIGFGIEGMIFFRNVLQESRDMLEDYRFNKLDLCAMNRIEFFSSR